MAASNGTLWQRRSDVLWREALGSLVLLPASADEPFVVSAPSAVLWEALSDPVTVDGLVAALEALQLAHERSGEALEALLEDLLRREAVRRVAPAP